VILGVGVDIVDVQRMERTLRQRWGETFLNRVFSEEEIATCRHSPHPAQGFAARFAAKEALVKALGTGFSRGITPNKVRVKGGDRSRPAIELTDAAIKVAEAMNVGEIHVALTHTAMAACAVVVVERKQ
jgi:holo-[acyl-carrier protein] synthase